jgi:tRNA wybutosine-synthesizing protein 1
MRCLFCWRVQSGDKGLKWRELEVPASDEPESIVEGCLSAQRKILSGYKANPKTHREKYDEALAPKHAAISLAGEPTLYPRLGELIGAFRKRGFTTFLVSNGTIPQALATLEEEPTQLYISACAPDKETFTKTCRPQVPKAWEKLHETFKILPSFNCPVVMRLTLVRNLNLKHTKKYSRIVEKAAPTYLETKAYMHVGFSRLRLTYEHTPSHLEIRSFAATLSKETGYKLLDESERSRVVLLSRLENVVKLG